MAKKCLVILILAMLAAGRLFAQETYYEQEYPLHEDATVGGAEEPLNKSAESAVPPRERDRVFTAAGGGIVADATRSGEEIDYRFWSQIFIGPLGFVDTEFFELSLGVAVGRIARRNRWCLLIVAVNPSLLFKVPVSVLGIHPLLGVGFDAIVWVREECLRTPAIVSDALPDRRTFMNFSAFKFKAGFGRDFGFSEDMFFRVRALGYYGRRLGNPHPLGGTLRLGVGRRL